jgi:hypothetical protein
MHLTAEMYEDIVRSLRSDVLKGTERRRHPRVGMRVRITIIILDAAGQPGKAESVWVRDLSDGGIGLVATRPMKRGVLFIVQFIRSDHQVLSLLCQVVQSHNVDLIIGARIIRALTPFETDEIAGHRPLVIDPEEIPPLKG